HRRADLFLDRDCRPAVRDGLRTAVAAIRQRVQRATVTLHVAFATTASETEPSSRRPMSGGLPVPTTTWSASISPAQSTIAPATSPLSETMRLTSFTPWLRA